MVDASAIGFLRLPVYFINYNDKPHANNARHGCMMKLELCGAIVFADA